MNNQHTTPPSVSDVQDHLHAELALVERLAELNQKLAATFNQSTPRGLPLEQTNELNALTDNMAAASMVVKEKRKSMLLRINLGRSDDEQLTLREYIQTLPVEICEELQELQGQIVARLGEVHAQMLGNQAVLFYSHDFFRKMVNQLLNIDPDHHQYSGRGQTTPVRPGNFIRKAC